MAVTTFTQPSELEPIEAVVFPTILLWKKGKEKIKNLSLNLEKEKPTEVGPASRSSVQLGKVKVK